MKQENGNNTVTLENLAGMIARGFEETAKKVEVDARFDSVNSRFADMDTRFDKIDGRLDHLDACMGRVEADLAEIRSNIVHRYEFEDLMARVKYVEKKLGIKSGK